MFSNFDGESPLIVYAAVHHLAHKPQGIQDRLEYRQAQRMLAETMEAAEIEAAIKALRKVRRLQEEQKTSKRDPNLTAWEARESLFS